MRPSHDEHPEDLKALRHAIGRLAAECSLDLDSRPAIRRFLDNDPAGIPGRRGDPKACQELRHMLVLLYRLEASSSEDLGCSGMHRLWHQHDEIVRRFRNEATG